MDTLKHYHEIVKALILEYASHQSAHENIKTEAIIDQEGGHYEVIDIGWDGTTRVHTTVLHIDIIKDKVWLQRNATSEHIAEELIKAGIPRESIVLGFYPEHIRPFTAYAPG